MLITELLKKENNNLHLIRLMLASLVIIGHSGVLNGVNHYWHDPVQYVFGITTSGNLAVNMFFFISGLVVTNSILQNRKPLQFVAARFFRIMPALLLVLLISVWVIGPMVTTLTLKDYFNQKELVTYVFSNLSFQVYYRLPGVFKKNLFPGAVNGSLWTLAYEISAYVILLAVFLLIRNKRRIWYNVLLFYIMIEAVMPHKFLFGWLGANPDINLLPAAFAFGSILAVNKDRVKLDVYSVCGMALLFYFFRNASFGLLIFNLTCSIFFLVLSVQSWFNQYKPKQDISFGVYLWGFPLQQMLYWKLGQVHTGLHCFLALLISVLLAWITHVLIEKPCIQLGRKFFRKETELGPLLLPYESKSLEAFIVKETH